MDATETPKLTYLITGLQYGGANIGMVRLLSELEPDEFDITVVSVVETSDDVVDMLPEHVTIHQLNISNLADTYRLPKLILLLRGTDVLVCSLFHASVVGIPIAHLIDIPNIFVWQHNTEFKNEVRRMVYKHLYRLSDHVLADSKAVSTMLSEEFDVPQTKVSELPIAGVDTTQFTPTETDSLDSHNIKIGTIARLVEQKGLFDLIACAKRLGSRYQFEIIGQGPQRRELEQDAPANVSFRGTVTEERLRELLASYDIYFQPSKHEGLCMTVIEAMSCGLPVVASSVGGIRESVIHNETGYLCDARNIDCFCSSLEKLATYQELRQEMGSTGRERVVTRYSKSALADAFREAVDQTKTV